MHVEKSRSEAGAEFDGQSDEAAQTGASNEDVDPPFYAKAFEWDGLNFQIKAAGIKEKLVSRPSLSPACNQEEHPLFRFNWSSGLAGCNLPFSDAINLLLGLSLI